MKTEQEMVDETMAKAGYQKIDMGGADGMLLKYIHNTKPHLWLSRNVEDIGMSCYTLRWQNGEYLVHSMEQLRFTEAMYELDNKVST